MPTKAHPLAVKLHDATKTLNPSERGVFEVLLALTAHQIALEQAFKRFAGYPVNSPPGEF